MNSNIPEISEQEACELLPRLDPTEEFDQSQYTWRIATPPEVIKKMITLQDGWSFVGWTYSAGIIPREQCKYLCRFGHTDGKRFLWHPVGEIGLRSLAEIVRARKADVTELSLNEVRQPPTLQAPDSGSKHFSDQYYR